MEYKWFSYVPQRNGTPNEVAGIFEFLQRREYMDDMQVYIANLGKYNEGELVCVCLPFPIDFEEVKEKIAWMMNMRNTPYMTTSYPLRLTNTSIGELNRLWEMVSEPPEELQSELFACSLNFSSIEEPRNIKEVTEAARKRTKTRCA